MRPTLSHPPPITLPPLQVFGFRQTHSKRKIRLEKILAGKERGIIGRTNRCDLRIRDNTVSCLHCEITREPDGGYSIADRGSKNGVYVSRFGRPGTFRRVKTRTRLHVGMHIELGDITLVCVDNMNMCTICARRASEFRRIARVIYGSAKAAKRYIVDTLQRAVTGRTDIQR